jgi:hypothetical protein
MAPEGSYFSWPHESRRNLVYEIDLTRELVDKIRSACENSVNEVAQLINTLDPFLNASLALYDEIAVMVNIRKPRYIASEDDFKRYNEVAFKGNKRSNEERKKLVEGLIDKWVEIKNGLLSLMNGKNSLINNTFENIVYETVYSACGFEATDRRFEIHVDNNLYPARVDNLRLGLEGKVYGVIHADINRELEHELEKIIKDSIQKIKNLMGSPLIRIDSIYDHIWKREGSLSGVRSYIWDLINLCNKTPFQISVENQRKLEL